MVNCGLSLPESPKTVPKPLEMLTKHRMQGILTNNGVIVTGWNIRDSNLNPAIEDVEALSERVVCTDHECLYRWLTKANSPRSRRPCFTRTTIP
jgi:hypothetical protein